MRKRIQISTIIITTAAMLCGCGEAASDTRMQVPRQIYQKAEYVTTTVHKGDMEPTFTLKLKAQLANQERYSIDLTDAEVEEVYVTTGERVEKGQLLVSFKSDQTRKEVEQYGADLEEKKLLLEHCIRKSMYDLQQREYLTKERKEYPLYQQQEDEITKRKDAEDTMHKAEDYRMTIAQLEEDVKLASMYLEEANARLERCQIRAVEDGVISYVSKGLMSGYVDPGSLLITEMCGQNTYEAYTDEDYDFEINQKFPAEADNMTYDMVVSEIQEEGNGNRTIIFRPDSELLSPPESSSLEMMIKKASLKDVIFVEREAVNHKDGMDFVYTVTPDGFLDAVVVDMGETVENMVVIKSGLSGDEKVAILK